MPGSYEHYFSVMEDLGFFDHIYERLPENFTAVFEIARVLEDPASPLTAALMPALRVSTAAARTDVTESADPQIYIEDVEETEAGLIRSISHLPRIYTAQWLLPDAVFERKLAKRELWVPYPRRSTYLSVEPDDDDYRPDSRKQKLYILLDTSSSMALHNRIHLAKAIVYHVLKHNMRELGYISLRTFDTKIGELHEARDVAGFHALISFVMRVHTLGNGTAMARALVQAVDDIAALPKLSGTEILVITDGAVALDEEAMRRTLGDAITLNTIKLGRAQVYASKSYIRDRIYEEDSAQHRQIEALQRKLKDMQRQRDTAQSPHLRKRCEDSIHSIEGEIARIVNAMTEEIVVGYGHELERLSRVYVTVDDVELASLLPLGETHDELRRIFSELCERIDTFTTLDQIRQLALLNDHLAFLVRIVTEAALREKLEQLHRDVTDRLTSTLREQLEASSGGILHRLTADDRHDLQFLVSHGAASGMPFWRSLLWLLLKRLRTLFS